MSQERFTDSLPATVASGLMVWIFRIRALPHGEISKDIQLPENWEKLKENLGEGQSFKPGHCLTSTKNQGVSATNDIVSFPSSESHTEIALIPSTVWEYIGIGILEYAVQLSQGDTI